MATVRFSDSLIDNIKSNASGLFNKPMQDAQKYGIPDDIGDQLYNWMFGDTIPTMKLLPTGYLETVAYMQVTTIGSTSVNERLNLTTPVPWPSKIIGNHRVTCRSWNSHEGLSLNPIDPEGHRFLGMFEVRDLKIKDVQFRRSKFINDVDKICRAYSTLAPALKAFPALWDLIPEDVKARHLEVKERKASTTAKELGAEIDLGSLTATVVASKMMR